MSADQEVVDAFLIESADRLEAFGETLIKIESQDFQDIEELIKQGFRQIHTVKGASGFLGFKIIEQLSHSMENLLDSIRSGVIPFGKDDLGLMLQCTSKLEECVQLGFDSNDINVDDLLDQLKASLTSPKEQDGPQDSGKEEDPWLWPFDEKLLEKSIQEELCFLIRSQEVLAQKQLSKVNDELKAIGTVVDEQVMPNGILYLIVETVLDLDMLCIAVEDIPLEGTRPSLELVQNSKEIPEAEEPSPKSLPAEKSEKQKLKPERSESKSAPKVTSKHTVDPTLRVRVNLLESLMELSSELVLSRNQLMDKMGKEAPFNVLSTQITELQDAVMKLRLQPLQVVFGKIPRMVRELANQLGKDVQLNITGKEVEVDRTMVDSLSDPLVHIIRNSLDHGMEMPSEREELGKRRSGEVRIDAYSQGGNVHIDISDDGKGIHAEIVAQKALEKGIVTEAELGKMSISEKQSLIFKAGFSTAQAVSSVSGRGVGMDVVRSKIEELGGKVILNSTQGKGTTLRLLLPMTVAVVPALIVECQGGKVAIPRVNISELVLVDGSENNRIEKMGNRPVYRLREELLSITPLDSALNGTRTYLDDTSLREEEERRQPGERRLESQRGDRRQEGHDFHYLIVMKTGTSRFGILVDKLHAPEEIVVKPLPAFCLNCDHYSGASILGNGMVVPIINPMELAHRAGLSLSDKDKPNDADKEDESTSATHHWLIARSGSNQFALPQQLVKRIDEVVTDQLQYQDEQFFMLREKNSSLPMILMDEMEEDWGKAPEVKGGFLVIPKYLPIEIGLHFDEVIGIANSESPMERLNKSESFMGKTVINGKLTKIIDIYGLTGEAMPSLQKIKVDEVADYVPPTSKNKKELKILIAEDSPIFTSIMKKTLQALGYEATFACNGVEALEAIKNKKYEILLSDIEMPEMDGLELMDELKSKNLTEGLETVALTGNQDERIRDLALSRGYQHFMIKFDKDKLGEWLDHFIIERERTVHV